MKSILSVAIFILATSATSLGQYWMQKAGGITIDEAYDIAMDASGNTYTVGYFTGTATFGSTSLTSAGSSDIFITKTDNIGNFVWAKKAGGTGSDRGLAIAVDATGNCFITGYFYNTASFGTTTITSAGLQDAFFAKYTSAGVLVWVKKAGGTASDIGNGISFNSSGDVVATGSFKGSATFGTTTLTSANTTSDVFITKLNSTGVFQWTKKGTGNYANRGVDVGCDNSGNVYVTGQFSDTITFDVAHNNTMQNVIFVLKYNSAGAEQWFKIIGGGASNTVYGIAVSSTGTSHLTGDFTGALTFFGASNTTITNPYLNKIFIAKYNSSGTVLWAKAEGSDNSITSRNIALDGGGNIYIGGHFSCKLNEYADNYGQGNFNAVGNFDVFVSKYNASGTWDFSRNIGGRQDDFCYGIAANNSGHIQMAGSFSSQINIPVSTSFLSANLANFTAVGCGTNSTYCSDPSYGDFYKMSSTGNKDVIIARSFDQNRSPYDFYLRSGGGCDRPDIGMCIDSLCPATVTSCLTASLTAFSKICDSIGPQVSENTGYVWSAGVVSTVPSIYGSVNVSGTYSVTQTSVDGCYTTTDSIQVVILPSPPMPTISDNQGFNSNALIPTPILLCLPDSVTITGGGFGTNTYFWTGTGLPAGGVFDSTINVTTSGAYQFHVLGANGCDIFNTVSVTIYPALPPFNLKLDLADSVTVCEGETVVAQLYDSISNPLIAAQCIQDSSFTALTSWTITPTVSTNFACHTYAFLDATVTGLYTVSATLVRINTTCGSDTTFLTQDVYITVNPNPIIPPFTIIISGGPFFCPGTTVDITASGGPSYTWYGPGVLGASTATVTATTAGVYGVGASVSDTNIFGCTAEYVSSASISILQKPQPVVSATDLIICPGDSILLSSSQGFNFWEGPNGPIAGSGGSIYVSDPGSYFTVVNDSDSCALVSNTIVLGQYTTPLLVPAGDTFICAGDSTTISVLTTNNSIIEWQAPLSGNSTTQVIYTPGTYTCKVTACGIETYASITISSATVLSQITGDSIFCEDSTLILSGLPGLASYLWMPGSLTTQTISVSSTGTYTLSVSDTNGCTAISDTFSVQEIIVPAQITASAFGFCYGDSVLLTANAGLSSYIWSPTGDTTQTSTVFSSGTYAVTLTDSNGCPGIASPVTITQSDTIATITLQGPSDLCENETVNITSATIPGSTYLWVPSNDTTPNIVVSQTGTYTLQTSDSIGCQATSNSILVTVYDNNLVTPALSNDTVICEGETILLLATTPSDSVYWYSVLGQAPIHMGDSLFVTVTQNTTYYAQSKSYPCESEYAMVNIITENCEEIEVPNIFTPNKDGINDNWSVYIYGATCFNLEIYNRWGTLIYYFEDSAQSWDGTMYQTGEAASDGTYYYLINYCTINGEQKQKRGNITLLR